MAIEDVPKIVALFHINNGGYQEGSVPRTALTQNQALWVLENYSGMILLDS
jgi:hypothetical protein